MKHTTDRSQLPEGFVSLPLEDSLRALLRAHLFDVETLKTLEAKHKALVDYIIGVTQ